jgi:segregation and condensation protein B
MALLPQDCTDEDGSRTRGNRSWKGVAMSAQHEAEVRLESDRGDQMSARSDQEGGGRRAVDEPPVPPASAEDLRGALEAILLIVDEPAQQTLLAQVLGTPEPQVVAALTALRAEYDAQNRGFELREVAGGWRLYTRASFAPQVERFVLDGQHARLTQAALETLAVVAYRQPVSRTRVSAVRGVNVDGVMRTLVARGLVEEAGSDNDSGAVLYRTSPYFLERLGLNDLAELPNLANFLPESTTIDALEDELSRED